MITQASRKAGRPISCADAWTAAVAIKLDAPVATHNIADFSCVDGLELITGS